MVLFAGKFMVMPSFAIFVVAFVVEGQVTKNQEHLVFVCSKIYVLKNILDVFHLCGFARITEDTTWFWRNLGELTNST